MPVHSPDVKKTKNPEVPVMGKMSVHKWNDEVAGACLLLGNRMEQGTRWSVGRIRANVVGFFGVPADWCRRRNFTPACSIRKGCRVGAACAVSRTCRTKDILSRRRVHNQHSQSVGVHPRTPPESGWLAYQLAYCAEPRGGQIGRASCRERV